MELVGKLVGVSIIMTRKRFDSENLHKVEQLHPTLCNLVGTCVEAAIALAFARALPSVASASWIELVPLFSSKRGRKDIY